MEENLIEQPRIKKESLLKKILLAGGETANVMKVSYLMGAGLGATGRVTGAEWIPAVLPVMELFSGAVLTSKRISCYTAYGAGVATAWADKIYEYTKPFLD